MGRAGLYCLETKLAKQMVGGSALSWTEGLQGQITHTPGRVLEPGRLLPVRGRPAHLSGARAASFLQLNPNEVSLTLTLPASPQVELEFMVSSHT